MSKPLVILGSGYTGRFLFPLATHYYSRIFATSRAPNRHLYYVAPDFRIRFDLTDRSTWKHIPTDTDLLWSFPATPLHLVQEFAATLGPLSGQIVVLGSTSAYRVNDPHRYPPPWIDETAPIDLTKPRVQSEEFLRATCNAIVLRVAGIYGPSRNPIDWIRSGKVRPSPKYVNLIHVENLARICLATLERGKPGEVYNVTDGTPRTWNDICQITRERWGLQANSKKETAAAGKRISNRKLLSILGPVTDALHHSDFFDALSRIQSDTVRPEAAP